MMMKQVKTKFLVLVLSTFSYQIGEAQTFVAGETYFGTNNHIEYKAGNLPLVISAPHGGALEPAEIPDRDCAGCVYVTDSNTEALVRDIYNAVFELFSCYPHVIINRLSRRKLDANRALTEAADGNEAAEQAWKEFHQFIETARDSVVGLYGKGLYLDLHGHGHDIQRLELGYRISGSKLRRSDTDLDKTDIVNESSIKHLVSNNLSGLSHSDLLRGANSFGELYEIEKYPAVPSDTDPFPFSGESYFSGGYNTERYGSDDGGTVDAIQIECNMDGVRDTDTNRKAFATSTAKVIKVSPLFCTVSSTQE